MTAQEVKIAVKIVGLSPLIVDRPDPGVLSGEIRLKGMTAEEQAQYSLYPSDDGKALIWPWAGLRKALYSAAVGMKAPAGKAGIGRYIPYILPVPTKHTFQLQPAFEILDSDGKPSVPEIFSTRVVRNRAGVIVHRPMFKDWSLVFELSIAWGFFAGATEAQTILAARTLLETAGLRAGIGNWRPNLSGGYGTFIVAEFEKAK